MSRAVAHRLASSLVILAAASSTARAQSPGPDVVYLTDGSQLSGSVVRQEPGKFVVMRTADGRETTLSWNEVRRVAASPGAAASAPAGAAPTPAESGRLQGDQLVLDRVVTLPPPPRSTLNLVIGGSFSYGFPTNGGDLKWPGGGFDLGLQALFGVNGPMPGPNGGTYHGLYVEPSLGWYGGGLIAAGGRAGAGAFMFRGGTTFGYQMLKLGEANRVDASQSAWGLMLGYRPGFQFYLFDGDIKADRFEFTHGPLIGLQFGDYKAAKAKLDRGYIYFSVTHAPDSNLVFLNLGGAGVGSIGGF